MNLPSDRFDSIAGDISSDASPVGIDARKTHVIIIYMLETIMQRLDAIEERLQHLEDLG